jgi:hypothetical protein
MQFFKPENYFEVRRALEQAGRTDLIGGGCDALIPAQPPKQALAARRQGANESFRGDYVHTIVSSRPKRGYRPGRKSAERHGARIRKRSATEQTRIRSNGVE